MLSVDDIVISVSTLHQFVDLLASSLCELIRPSISHLASDFFKGNQAELR